MFSTRFFASHRGGWAWPLLHCSLLIATMASGRVAAAEVPTNGSSVRVGFGFGVGTSPSRGFPALTADLFPIEVQVPVAESRALAFQVDWAQAILESYLLSRRTVGLVGYHQWSVPVVRSVALDAGIGLDTEWGLLAGSADGRRTRKPVLALGPSARIGASYGGRGGRFRQTVYLRGTFGRDFVPGDDRLFARALVETTFLWGVR